MRNNVNGRGDRTEIFPTYSYVQLQDKWCANKPINNLDDLFLFIFMEKDSKFSDKS